MIKKRIAIIGTVGLPSNYGGFETLTNHLVEHLNEIFNISVYCSKVSYPKEQRQTQYKGANLVYMPFKPNGIQSIAYDSTSMLHSLFFSDILLVLGVSGGLMLPFIRLFTKKKIIVSIDGLEWKRNKWHKWARWFLWASEWIAVKCAHANIADNESIQDYTAMRYKVLSNIIEYGADHVYAVKPEPSDYKKYPFLSLAYAVKVCRIEPENNIHTVLEAFSIIEKQTLVLIGNWSKSEYGISLKEKYAGFANMKLLDPIYDEREINLIRSNATVYIHGHSAGGTNPSLVEAMYLGLPVIAYGVSYNRTTTESEALYFKNTEELVSIIKNEKIKRFKEIGATMKLIAERRYVWDVISKKYEYLLNATFENSLKTSLKPLISKQLATEKLIDNDISHLQSTSFFYE
jgi:glycosyltransferase involved in cell wall biosynthesis